MSLPINQIICGTAKEVLQTFPTGSISCCISSPPYWALRDYGVEGQLGLEPTFDCGIVESDLMKLKGGLALKEKQEVYAYFGLGTPV